MSEIALFRDLSVTLGDRTFLRNQNLSVEAGSITVLMGRSGAGKSLLADIVFRPFRLHSSPSGLVVDGELGNAEDKGGLVFQGEGGVMHLSVLDNLLLVSRDEKMCDSLLKQFELPPDRLASDLSGGERRRLGVARALLAKRDVTWLDEPEAGLDFGRVRDLAQTLKAQSAEGVAIVVTTHDRDFAAEIGHRFIFLDTDGEFKEMGRLGYIAAS